MGGNMGGNMSLNQSVAAPKKFYTIQRVNGNGGNGKGDGVAGPHKHSLEESDKVKKNSVLRWMMKSERDKKRVQVSLRFIFSSFAFYFTLNLRNNLPSLCSPESLHKAAMITRTFMVSWLAYPKTFAGHPRMHLLIRWRPRHFSGEIDKFTRLAGLIYNHLSAIKVWLSLFLMYFTISAPLLRPLVFALRHSRPALTLSKHSLSSQSPYIIPTRLPSSSSTRFKMSDANQGGDPQKKTYHKKATGNALTTVKNHSKEDELKLFGSCFW